MSYEWDEAKQQANIKKHGIAFTRIEDFEWETAVVIPSSRSGELRWAAIAYIGDRLHHVVFTERGDSRRIISLRKANLRERNRYDQVK